MHVFKLMEDAREQTENPCRTYKVWTGKSRGRNPNPEPSLERDSSLFKHSLFFFFPSSSAETLRLVLRVYSSRLPVAAVLLVVASERARHTQDFGGFELTSIITVGSHRQGPLFIYWLQPTGSLDCGNHTERRGAQRRSVCGDSALLRTGSHAGVGGILTEYSGILQEGLSTPSRTHSTNFTGSKRFVPTSISQELLPVSRPHKGGASSLLADRLIPNFYQQLKR